MDTKVLFCNIAWMKNYIGITDDDKPINGGAYIKKNQIGGEIYNFQDYNGKCYGYVMTYGNMALENHFKGVNKNNEYVDGVLVVWVATSEKNETRIVGWYKNAMVYRSFQYQSLYSDPNENLRYNILADAKDCFLLPVGERIFPIERAAQVGAGMGIGRSNIWYADSEFARANIVPKVIQFVEEYKGDFINLVYSDEEMDELINSIQEPKDFQELYDKGMHNWETGDLYTALAYLLKAKQIKEDVELLYSIGACMYDLWRYDQSIAIYKRIIEIEGEHQDSLCALTSCYIAIGGRDGALEYAYRLLDLLDDSESNIDLKVNAYRTIFTVYRYNNQPKEAEETAKLLAKHTDYPDIDKIVKSMKDILMNQTNDLIMSKE